MLQQIYTAFGGTNKGITFRDLLCGLVLLTRGTREEKIKCKYMFEANIVSISNDSFCLV